MADPAIPTPEAVRLAARAAALDAAAAEIVTELRERGVRPILLKGPSIASWLYAPSELRAYGDIDLLIAPADFEVAEETFRELGFLHFPVAGVEHGDAWVHHSKQVDFELHRRLVGMNAAPGEVWSCLACHTTSLEVFGVSLEILDIPARTMQVALHAAQHGTEIRKPREDLVRALEQVSYEDWTAALSLARELDAAEAFAAGLRLLPEGERLAE